MAEEPILCFDGDKAGRKAAYRALDTALPLIGPGRACVSRSLPEGQDPDDLARSGGREALESVLASSEPLVEMLFLREAEAQALDTPERRAALERRLRECGQARFGTSSLRRHYFDDLRDRLGRPVRPVAGGRTGSTTAAVFAQLAGIRAGRSRCVRRSAPSSALLQIEPFRRAASEAPAPRETLILALC